VSRLATRRLIDAAATLEPPERALMNLWVNQGLGDAEVARMTGMSESVIAERRARIVEHLTEELGLPPEDIRAALDTIVPGPETASPEPEAPSVNGSAAMAAEAAPDGDEAAPSRSSPSRRRLLWAGLTLVVLVVLIVALTSGGSSRRPRSAVASTRSATPAPAGTSAQSQPPNSSAPLLVLSGGPTRATGSVKVNRIGHTVRLDLSVRNLPPAASHGHYEVWLYDSLIYSEDLGRLRAGVTHVSLRMPADAGHYRWIDVSFQPLGRVFHSGESILRSTNPLAAKVKPSP
jgi:hypothetical protein